MEPRLNAPALRAATRAAVGKPQAVISAAPAGAACDISLPASQPETARKIVESLALRWNEAAESDAYKSLLWIPKSVVAGELFEQNVEHARNRFTKRMGEVAADYAKTGKYTEAHAKAILAGREALKAELTGIVPTRFGMNASRASDMVTGRLEKDIEALRRVSGKTQRNLARGAVKRGSMLTYADDVPVVADLKLAKALKSVDKYVQVLEFAPAAAVLLSTKDDRERERALAEIGGKAYGMLAERAVTLYGPMFCASFGLATMGWGFLACGLVTYGAGFYLGTVVEKEMTKVLTAD